MAEEGLKIIRSIIELNGSIFAKAISLLQSLESVSNKDVEKRITYIRQEKFNSYKNIEELLVILKQALVLVQQEKWVSATNGEIPVNAVSFGEDSHGEQLYIARAQHSGLHPGKVGRHMTGASIPFGGKELIKEQYEVLVIPSQLYEWYPCSSVREIPRMAVKGGFEKDGKPLYVARAIPPGAHSFHIGKVGCHISGRISFNEKEHKVSEFEVLVFSKGMEWMQNHDRLKAILSNLN